MYVKGKLFRDTKYLKWVRSRPCVVSEREADVVAHHVRLGGGGGIGIKPSDYRTVPLHTEEHFHLHNKGEASYWKEKGIDPFKVMITQMIVYLSLQAPKHNGQDTLMALENAVWHLSLENRKTLC